MDKPSKPSVYKTRQQIADELGMSYSTFWRKLKEHTIILPRGLINPQTQKEIYEVFGFPELSEK